MKIYVLCCLAFIYITTRVPVGILDIMYGVGFAYLVICAYRFAYIVMRVFVGIPLWIRVTSIGCVGVVVSIVSVHSLFGAAAVSVLVLGLYCLVGVILEAFLSAPRAVL